MKTGSVARCGHGSNRDPTLSKFASLAINISHMNNKNMENSGHKKNSQHSTWFSPQVEEPH